MNRSAGISVVLCCYNSVNRLGPTLEHLAKQKAGAFPVEVVVVDNNSSDDTGTIALKIWADLKVNFPLRVVKEETPGLMHARRKGVSESSYEFLVFCDDDNWLCESYLNTVYQYFSAHPEVGAIGGEGVVVADEVPAWFSSFSRQYACFAQRDDQVLYGAGMSVRTSILEHIFANTPEFFLSGRVGGRLIGGDDHELGFLIFWTGFKVKYVPELKFKHYMPHVRLTLSYLRNLLKGAGYSAPFLWPYEPSRGLLSSVIIKGLRLLAGFPKIFLTEFFSGNLLLRIQMHAIYSVEVWSSVLKNWSKIKKIDAALRERKAKYLLR